ncbi:MAG: PQQ-binding-like beta-propeller repeat protein [bacterium]
MIGSDGSIYALTFEYLYAINPDGKLKWRCRIGEAENTSPAIGSNGTIYVGGEYLLAINSNGTLEWVYLPEEGLCTSPVIGIGDTIYIAGDYLYALTSEGELKWLYPMSDYVESSPAIGPDGSIYVSCWDGYLYAIYGSGNSTNSPWPLFQHDLKHTGRAGGGFRK